MRLGFHYHIPVWNEGGSLRMPGYLSFFVDSLARHVEHLVCLQYDALPGERRLCDSSVRSANVSFVSLGPHLPVHRRLFSRPDRTSEIAAAVADLDVLLVRGPTPLLPRLGGLARRCGVPTALLIVGDYVRSVGSMAQPLPKRLVALLLALWNRKGQRKIARRSLVFVNSRELLREFEGVARRAVETRTTTLRTEDIVLRGDTCEGKPIVVLYAGRLDWAKGLADIAEAVLSLLDQGLELRLEIVGWEEGAGGVEDRLREMFGVAGHPERFVGHGRKAAGPELLACYRAADIYVTASRRAEGFPRTIWEAMASSTPVIATGVGSIPHFLEDGRDALLVPPENPGALAEAIHRVCTDRALRKTLITNGNSLARGNTLEHRSREMIDEVEAWLGGI